MRSCIPIFLGFILILSGCSKQALDANTAFASIDKKLNGEAHRLMVRVGRVGSHCVTLDVNGQTYPVDINPDKDLDTMIASRAGYVAVTPDGKDFWKVALTSSGQAFLDSQHERPYSPEAPNGCSYSSVDMTLARPVAVKVTSISGDNNAAEATYAWKWQLTDLGTMLRDNGAVYSNLTPEQKAKLTERLSDTTFAPAISAPLPPDQQMNSTYEAKAEFKRSESGWRLQ